MNKILIVDDSRKIKAEGPGRVPAVSGKECSPFAGYQALLCSLIFPPFSSNTTSASFATSLEWETITTHLL